MVTMVIKGVVAVVVMVTMTTRGLLHGMNSGCVNVVRF
jgi:hypothetical protein